MPSRHLALFDLDLTLIPFDSGMAWTQFLIAKGILPAQAEARYLAYCHEYVAGTLDIHAMHRNNMKPLLEYPRATLAQWQQEFAKEIAPRLPVASLALVKKHRENGDLCAIVTATTRLIAQPIAQLFGVAHLVATRPATVGGLEDGAFTGEIDGEPCYRHHKVSRVGEWLAAQPEGAQRSVGEFEKSWFYSDSMGDLPLLCAVTHPVVVSPDERLRAHAAQAGWPVIDLA
ncbi:HAD family hydrolase [Variovorax sp. J22R133]|uniref:HAD family hydrolase n=1 Tax=Variovorax brevis TaxID=3053503 RepID=UPI002577055E|nr:HAD family hydrolase [Variovorax sp. J22R133]MDM0111819.1 HAD family hydrolase [Variovorax sp. J22R133]